MQTIDIDVNDNNINKDKKIEAVDESSTEFINAQISSMAKTWDNSLDKAWDETFL